MNVFTTNPCAAGKEKGDQFGSRAYSFSSNVAWKRVIPQWEWGQFRARTDG